MCDSSDKLYTLYGIVHGDGEAVSFHVTSKTAQEAFSLDLRRIRKRLSELDTSREMDEFYRTRPQLLKEAVAFKIFDDYDKLLVRQKCNEMRQASKDEGLRVLRVSNWNL